MNKVNSVYIHIPFCKQICSYCDFCKIFYDEKYINNYLLALEKEIKSNYKGDLIKTIYIGGGTPSSLKMSELKKLFDLIKLFNLDKNFEFTIETNIEDVTIDKLNLFYQNKINRLSIGVQTFNRIHLQKLGRSNVDNIINRINLAKKVGFNNINIDLMYALPNQTLDELLEDLEKIIKLDITHISTYSLIIEPHTLLYIEKTDYIDEDLDYEMYELIREKLIDNGYNHYEISNFSKSGYESKHNLTYWSNDEYYGFGMGASGYLNNIRYENNKNINKYISGIYRADEEYLTKEDILLYEFILGLRKIKGINKQSFYQKFKFNIKEFHNVSKLLKEGKLIDDGENIYINSKYLYISNEILVSLMV